MQTSRLCRVWWMGVLWGACLWLGGCDDPFSPQTTPELPRWSDQNPKQANDNRLVLRGSARRATAVQIFLAAECQGEVHQTVPLEGEAFTVTLEVPDDQVTRISALSLDESTGLRSQCSATYSYTEDSTPPQAPVFTGTNPPSPNRALSTKLLGTAEPGSRIIITSESTCPSAGALDVRANSSGQFEASVSLSNRSDGTVRFYAAATDAVGNRSGCAGPLEYVVDRTPPPVPQLLGVSPRSPSNDNAPKIRGTAEPGTLVQVRQLCGSGLLGEGPTGADGSFEVTAHVSDNTFTRFAVSARDAAGNHSECSYTASYEEDSVPPEAPRLEESSTRSPGSSRRPHLTGSTAVNGTVQLYAGEGCTGTPVATSLAPHATFHLYPDVPADTLSVFSMKARDEAGNESICSERVTYLHDGLAPDGSTAVVTDGPGEDLRFQTHGLLEAHWTPFSDANGVIDYQYNVSRQPDCTTPLLSNWLSVLLKHEARMSTSVPDGQYYQCVRAKDAAGNVSAIVRSNGVRVDTVPPQVASHTPGANSTGADIRGPITLVFSEPVNAATVEGRFSLMANGSPVAGSLACAQERCTFTPAEALPYLETLTATVEAGVEDSIGRPLAATYRFSFTTRGRNWGSAAVTLHGVRPGANPEVAVDGQGRALGVWTQGGPDNTWRMYASRSDSGAEWGPAQVLDAGAPGNAARPALAVNAAGRGMALWELQQGTQVDLFSAEYAPGTGWSPPQPVESLPARASHPRVVVNSQGHSLAVWRQPDGTDESVWAAHHVPGQGWSTPVLLETGPGAVSAPALAMDPQGHALVAWLQPDGADTRVLASRYTPGGGWTVPTVLATSVTGSTVAVGLGGDGSGLVLFRRSEFVNGATIHRLFSAHWAPTQGWSAAVPASQDSQSVEGDFVVALDAEGNALTAWSQIRDFSSLYTCRFMPEQGWSTCQQATVYAAAPSVGVDGNGNFHIVWIANSFGVERISTARYPSGASSISPPQFLEGFHEGTSKRPRVAVNAAGAAVGVWARDNGTGSSGNLIYVNSYR